jgi:cell division protease FtsH
MVTELGMSDLGPIQYEQAGGNVFLGRDYTNSKKNFSGQVAFEIDTAVRAIISECHDLAEKTLRDNKEIVINIAEALLERETLTSEEIYAIAQMEPPVYDENGNKLNANKAKEEETSKKKKTKKTEVENQEEENKE